MFNEFKSYSQFLDYFKDEQICVKYLEYHLWGDTPSCPHCGCTNAYKTNRGYKCSDKHCHKKFTVTSGTIYRHTKVSLRTWLSAMYLTTSFKKGISSLQLAKMIGVSDKTAWFMLRKIRNMFMVMTHDKLTSHVQADETFVGGKNKNRHADKKYKGVQGRAAKDKVPVLGLVTNEGTVRTFVVKDTEANTLQKIVKENVEEGATFVSDAYKSYIGLNKHYNHIRVKHNENGDYKFAVTNTYNTNRMEGFWTWVKRGYMGTHHYMSRKHLQAYCDEISFRYNTRKLSDKERLEQSIKLSYQGQITYRDIAA
ncbi:IS1595 family transposase [Pedobacter mendelii]|uniref:DDE transposase n=1 Tax=Pedobacter mendelii TaxID=1908240 RepID=A0ABQ2BG38_9SPHI|nr:IS1595 family transposase [Pedobacter mendelii]GGI23655.1 DDE transposase [Pedobacter mendelii]